MIKHQQLPIDANNSNEASEDNIELENSGLLNVKLLEEIENATEDEDIGEEEEEEEEKENVSKDSS